jgi:dTMP kinase
MPVNRKGLFIVLEGPDRSGKSTHTKKLVKYLEKTGFSVACTREPGGTGFAEIIRKMLLNPKHKVTPIAELLLYEASRAQNTYEKIIPALKNGSIVLCERYTMSSIAYQGYGRKIPVATVEKLNKIATFGLKPNLTIIFDMPPEHFEIRSRGLQSDRLELENMKFKTRVRKAYLRLAKKTPNTILVNTDKPVRDVQKILRKKIDGMLKRYKK